MRRLKVLSLVLLCAAACAAVEDNAPSGEEAQPSAVEESPPPSERIPILEPWLKRDIYQVVATENPDLNGTIEVVEAAGGRSQSRVSLRIKSETLQDLVLEARFVDDRIDRFRLLKREAGEDEEVEGQLEGPELVVRWGGEERRIPWSEERRFGGPLPKDFIATGFKPGRSFSLEVYEPSWDKERCLTRSYVMGKPKVYRTPLGEQFEATSVEVNVPRPGKPPQVHLLLVDRKGRVLQRTQLLQRISFRLNAYVISLIESSEAPG